MRLFPKRYSEEGAQSCCRDIRNVTTLPAQPSGYCRRHSPGFPTVMAGREGQGSRKVFWYRLTRDNGGNYNTTDEVICYRFKLLPFGARAVHFCFRCHYGK